jgi:hypothetical protein
MRSVLHHPLDRLGADAVELLDGAADVGMQREGQFDAHARGQAQRIDQAGVEGVVGGHLQGAVLDRDGDDVVLEDGAWVGKARADEGGSQRGRSGADAVLTKGRGKRSK